MPHGGLGLGLFFDFFFAAAFFSCLSPPFFVFVFAGLLSVLFFFSLFTFLRCALRSSADIFAQTSGGSLVAVSPLPPLGFCAAAAAVACVFLVPLAAAPVPQTTVAQVAATKSKRCFDVVAVVLEASDQRDPVLRPSAAGF